MKTARDIIVMDDESVVVEGVARICGSQGWTVDTEDSGSGGLDRLGRCSYRLVLCDIMMQTLDGFHVLAELARRGDRTPVVMITGYATVENAVRSLICGAIDFIAKPFTADELLAVVGRGLSYGRFMEEEAALAGAPSVRTNCPVSCHRLGYVSWAAIESTGTALVGVNGLFVSTINGVQSVDLSPVGSELVQGNSCALITATNGLAHSVMCPLSGRVLDVNARVLAHPAMLASDPYTTGWLYRILPSDLKYNLKCLRLREAAHGGSESP